MTLHCEQHSEPDLSQPGGCGNMRRSVKLQEMKQNVMLRERAGRLHTRPHRKCNDTDDSRVGGARCSKRNGYGISLEISTSGTPEPLSLGGRRDVHGRQPLSSSASCLSLHKVSSINDSCTTRSIAIHGGVLDIYLPLDDRNQAIFSATVTNFDRSSGRRQPVSSANHHV